METKSKNKAKFISQCATLLKQGIALVLVLILFTSASMADTTEIAPRHNFIGNGADSLNYKSYSQNTLIVSHSSITIAAFSTININKKLAVNPFISGSIGGYYFENRYNYEAYNSASVNIGRKLDKKIAGFEITPMMGLVVGGFKGVTSEIQAFHENEQWYFSLDNQYTLEYTTTKRSFYYNWLVARFKFTRFLRVGISTQFTKAVNQKGVFDRGLTASFLYENLALNIYAFNYEAPKRNYMLSMRYYLKLY